MECVYEEGDQTNSSLFTEDVAGAGRISSLAQGSRAVVESGLSLGFSDMTGEFSEEAREELLREIDELKSENEYLKDEMDELRSEMLEMRDMYMEEDVYQLQDLRQQLDQANKTCRVLHYRLRKAERRNVRVAQTGRVDGELITTLEHDVRVAKIVSVRLHSELEAVQKKKCRMERENEKLREKLQDLEVAKQVLQAEMNKTQENSLKRRSLRSASLKGEKKLSPEDDSADLECQLHFAKEESALMCKKLTKIAMENEVMREELTKYRLLYGEVDDTQAEAGTTNSSHTREAEARVHLRLVEEEAKLLSRRIVELEVENNGLRTEMGERERGSVKEEELINGAGEEFALPLFTREQDETGECVDGKQKGELSATETDFEVIHTHPDDQHLEKSSISYMDRDCLKEGERMTTVESRGNEVNKLKSDCSLGVDDIEGLHAIHDQALLVRSNIELLTTPEKAFPQSNPMNTPYMTTAIADSQLKSHQWLLDPMLSPLTNGLEVLQAQLCALVEKLEMLPRPITDYPECAIEVFSEDLGDTKMDHSNELKQKVLGDKGIVNPSVSPEEGFNQDSLVLLTIQLRWFLQQWRLGERAAQDQKKPFEMFFQHDFDFLKNKQKSMYHPEKKCSCQVKNVLVSELRLALQDLVFELFEERRTFQFIVQEYANAKATWAVETAELKSLLEDSTGKTEGKSSSDMNMAVQREHVEKLQQLLVESYAALMHTRRQKCASYEMMTKKVERSILQTSRSTRTKNWRYLSQEAAALDREEACKTWDVPIMPPSFPFLNLNREINQRSHTAPEKTSIRIYYSPPSAKRIQLTSVLTAEAQKRHPTALCDLVNQGCVASYQNWLDNLLLKYQTSKESKSTNLTSSLASTSHLAFNNLDVTTNLSDDMKEMTANVLQTSQSSSSDQTRARDSGYSVVSTGTQTQFQTKVPKTDGPKSLYVSKNWSPQVTSFASARAQQTGLQCVPGLSEQLQLQPSRRTSAYSLVSSKSFPSPTPSSCLSASRSLNDSTQMEKRNRNQNVWASLQNASAVSSPTSRSSNSTSIQGKDSQRNVGVQKYGLVQEFLRNVCGRGEKTDTEVAKARVARRNNVSLAGSQSCEPTECHVPVVSLVRKDSKVGKSRLIKQSQKETSVNLIRRGSDSKSKSLEDKSYDCSSQSLTSCFTRPKRNLQYTPCPSKTRPPQQPPSRSRGDEPAIPTPRN